MWTYADTEQTQEAKTAFLSTAQKIFDQWCMVDGNFFTSKTELYVVYAVSKETLIKTLVKLYLALTAGQI